jgi:hypothetical protein
VTRLAASTGSELTQSLLAAFSDDPAIKLHTLLLEHGGDK